MAEGKRGGWRRLPFTAKRQEAFLAALAETCNVRAACEAAQVAPTTAYQRRRCDPGFGEAWQEAMAMGYDRIESLLVGHVLAVLGGEAAIGGEAGGDGGAAGESGQPAKPGHAVPGSGIARGTLSQQQVQLALLLLNRHRATVEGRGKPIAHGRCRPTPEETNAALTKKLDALARKLGRDI